MSTKKFLELKQWNPNHSSVWREIVSRFGQADYDDESIRTTREETLKNEWDAQEFGRNRQSEYPSIQDVVVALAEKEEGDDTAWQEITAQRAKVKSDNPKPK